MTTVGQAQNVISGLENAAQKHEIDLVIDLGVDRLLKWIGVYTILALAVVAKISDYVGPNLSCYPAGKSSGFDGNFIEFATTYCWESLASPESNTSVITHNGTSQQCEYLENKNKINLLKNPSDMKLFIHWLPYCMLVQAFLFALPPAFWHFRVGARVLGHVKFMQLLIIDIFEKVKGNPSGYYRGNPYDERSEHLDGLRLNNPKKSKIGTPSKSAKATFGSSGTLQVASTALEISRKSSSGSLQEVIAQSPHQDSTSIHKNTTNDAENNSEKIELLVCKEIKSVEDLPSIPKNITSDAENNSSDKVELLVFEEDKSAKESTSKSQPNTMSAATAPNSKVFNLNPYTPEGGFGDEEYEPQANEFYPLTESLLYHWCNGKNFNNIFLVRQYALKLIFSMVNALAMLTMMAWCIAILHDDFAASETFRCQLPYQDLCVLCAIKRKRDVYAIFWCDVVLTFIVFATSLIYWILGRTGANRATCHFFKDMKATCNVALGAAALVEKKKKA